MTQEKYRLPPIGGIIAFIIALTCISFFFQKNIPSHINIPYHLEWNQQNKNKSLEISGFYESENWIGNYTLDTERSLDGNTGLNLFSLNNKVQEIKLNKTMDITRYDNVKLTIYVENESIAKQIETFTFYIILKNGQKRSVLIPPLQRGWNVLTFPLSTFTVENKKIDPQNWEINSLGFNLIAKKLKKFKDSHIEALPMSIHDFDRLENLKKIIRSL